MHLSAIYPKVTLENKIYPFEAPIIFRSFFGPIIPGRVVLLIIYSRCISIVGAILTLGYGALVQFGFIVNFGRMAELSEKVVMREMYGLCSSVVGRAVLYDLIYRWENGIEFSLNVPFLVP